MDCEHFALLVLLFLQAILRIKLCENYKHDITFGKALLLAFQQLSNFPSPHFQDVDAGKLNSYLRELAADEAKIPRLCRRT